LAHLVEVAWTALDGAAEMLPAPGELARLFTVCFSDSIFALFFRSKVGVPCTRFNTNLRAVDAHGFQKSAGGIEDTIGFAIVEQNPHLRLVVLSHLKIVQNAHVCESYTKGRGPNGPWA